MPLPVECPQCGKSYRVPDEKAGLRFKCRQCGGTVTVPDDEFSALPAPSPRRRAAPTKRRTAVQSPPFPWKLVLSIGGGVLLVLALASAMWRVLSTRSSDGAAPSVAAEANTGSTAAPPPPTAPVASATESYAEARKAFSTKLLIRTASPQRWDPLATPPGAADMPYVSDGLSLKAYVTPDPGDGRRHAAVIFLHGGFAFGAGDWADSEPFRRAGFVVMTPILRGENGQPGEFTTYFREIDDVLAATRTLAALPYVDPGRICICGHSAGGTLAALAAMSAGDYRAAAPFSGCMNQQMNLEIAVFDPKDQEEIRIRSPLYFPASFQCPVRMFYGSQESWAKGDTQALAAASRQAGLDVQAIEVPGDHFTSLPPAMAQAVPFFQKMTAD